MGCEEGGSRSSLSASVAQVDRSEAMTSVLAPSGEGKGCGFAMTTRSGCKRQRSLDRRQAAGV